MSVMHHQSAYRTAHSTETALVRVSYDTLQATDNRQSMFLVLLGMSTAFDTIINNNNMII